MALGTLSPDQKAFADQVAAGTGLAPSVVVAWIGAESGWGVTKSGHNYLNIGPGRNYGSTSQAAGATVNLLESSNYYKGIRAAVTQTPQAQISAIVASPWDAGHYGTTNGQGQSTLGKIWAGITGGSAPMGTGVPGPSGSSGSSAQPAGIVSDALGWLFGGLGNSIVEAAIKGAIYVVFVVGGLALIGLGLARLTSVHPKQVIEKGSTIAAAAAVL